MMNKNIFTLKGTPVPTIVGLLALLWASGFTGVLYMVYETETNAETVSIQTRIPELFN